MRSPIVNPVFGSVLAGSILMFVGGTALTWSSPVLPKLQSTSDTPFVYPISAEQSSWISSLVTLGAAIGSFIFGYLADKVGRRYSILLMGVPFLVSYALMASVETVEAFYAARVITGLVVGGCFAVLPLYFCEISSKSHRGAVTSIISVSVVTGFLFSYVLGPWITVRSFNTILATFPACFLALYFFLGEETAHFYVLQNEDHLARITLMRIRGKGEEIEDELREIREKVREQRQGSLMDTVTSRAFIKGFTMAVGLLVFQQFTGINGILMYSQNIFQMTGSSLEPAVCTIVLGCVQFASSLTTPFIADKFGRRAILIFSAVGMIISQLPLGVYCYMNDLGKNVDSIKFLPITTLTMFMFAYNSGFGPIPWIIMAEVFPARVKTIGSSAVTAINWVLAFTITKYFGDLIECVGLGQSFWLFASCCAVSVFFVLFCVVETKGKTLEEIQDDLKK
ncbi:hypothetical protein JTB14_037666 [Gonioctena quinquepunctata]|nr:hypothetical protein JTB14_037666 [Gonioctena quinquepunctata]